MKGKGERKIGREMDEGDKQMGKGNDREVEAGNMETERNGMRVRE